MKLVKCNLSLLKPIICIFFMHISFASAVISPELPDMAKPIEENNLFINKIEQIKNMQTVTYFFTEKSISQDVKNTFKEFANNLGLTHGAIVINRKSQEYLKYNKIMQCDINISSSDLIVFENRVIKKIDKKCAYFYINDLKKINEILNIINRYKGDSKKLQSYSSYIECKKFIKNSCSSDERCKKYEKSIDNFVDMVFEKLINKI